MVPEQFTAGLLKCTAPEVTFDHAEAGATCQHVIIENATDRIKSSGNDKSEEPHFKGSLLGFNACQSLWSQVARALSVRTWSKPSSNADSAFASSIIFLPASART